MFKVNGEKKIYTKKINFYNEQMKNHLQTK
jgi:hypothetical protein